MFWVLLFWLAIITVIELCVFTNGKDEIDLYILIFAMLMIALLIGTRVMT